MKILILMIISLSLWANIGNIMAIKGSANVKRAETSLNATNGMVLLEGDEIVTNKKSRVQVILKDDTVVTIGANSTFSFLEFEFNKSKESKISMKASRGFFRSVTGKIAKVAPERFKVVTLTATIGIRGTDFSGEITPDKEIIKCYEGTIFVEFDGDSNNIEAGNLIEIIQNNIEIRKMATNFTSNASANTKITSVEEESGVVEDVVPEVTQATEDDENYAPEEGHYNYQ